MPKGCIYVARNDDINPPNLYKIGKTEFAEPHKRMKELTNETTNWNGEFEAKAWVLVEDVDKCERIIHRELSSSRVRRNREFFFNPVLSSITMAETPKRSSVRTVKAKCSGLPPVSPS